jgi:hypothetical protein
MKKPMMKKGAFKPCKACPSPAKCASAGMCKMKCKGY